MQSPLSSSGTLLERENNRRSNQARRVHCKRSSAWADLPEELLEIISRSLNIVDYQNLGRVCRSWRLFYSEFKQSFLTSHSPLIVYASTRAKKYCYFFDIATRMKYKTKLPRHICNFKFCLGVSSGYLIMLCLKTNDVSRDYLWVINPFTGHQIQFPCMPWPHCIEDYHDSCFSRSIFASFFASFGSQGQDFLIMILSKYVKVLQFCISRDNKWKQYHYYNKGGHILDIVVFDGRIYVINSDSRIGIFNLRYCDLRFLELNFAPRFGSHFDKSIRLVASNGQLFVVDSPKVYRIDLSRKEWVKVYNLGDQALFLGHGDMMCSKVINPSKWGGQSNCIYDLFPFNKKEPWKTITRYNLFPFNHQEPRETIIVDFPQKGEGKGYASTKICSWYFLPVSSSIENVRDE
ncbi:probable F-box protein At4g22060 [Pistacia vera]|uniref:probable F-box protein At4g22060 n=1 Tax=Pistacia vera TaxID=55513 RepID=UPI001262D2AB|nr:probable F-box protein At4g22060 [Pistacia vera]